MTRSVFTLKIIRFVKTQSSALYEREVSEISLQTRRALNEALRSVKRDNRLWLSLTREAISGGAIWIAISERHSWITYWPDSESVDTHAMNPTRADSSEYIEFLLDNTQPQMILEAFTFDRGTAWDVMGHFVVHGSPPATMTFSEELDTY